MRILLMNDDFPPRGKGGGAVIVEALAQGYCKAGHEVTVLTTHQDAPTDEEGIRNGCRLVSLALAYRRSLRPYLSLWNPQSHRKIAAFFAASPRFDAVHAHNVHSFLTYDALRIARAHGGKVIVTFHDVMSFSYGRLATPRYLSGKPGAFDYRLSAADHIRQAGMMWNPLRNALIRGALRHAHRHIAVSHALRDALVGNGIAVDRVIHNGIDFKNLPAVSDRSRELRRAWELEEKLVFFFGGRLSRDKGLAELLEALSEIRGAHPSAIVLIAGEESRAKALLQSIPRARELAGHLRVTGWLDRRDLLAALALSTLCTVPSVCFDSFPTVNIEAMALGKPVIATHFGGSRELVWDGVTGFIVNPFDTAGFRDRLRFLLDNPHRAKAMGEAGRKRVAEEFSLKAQVEKYLSEFGLPQ